MSYAFKNMEQGRLSEVQIAAEQRNHEHHLSDSELTVPSSLLHLVSLVSQVGKQITSVVLNSRVLRSGK